MKPRFPAIALALVMPIALHAQEEANGPAQKPTRAIWIGSSSAEFDDLSSAPPAHLSRSESPIVHRVRAACPAS
jgi:hypothetical protein